MPWDGSHREHAEFGRRMARETCRHERARRAALGPGTGTISGMAHARVGNQPGQMRLALLSALLLARTVAAETPAAEPGPMLRLTAVTANVTGAPDSIRIDV